MNTHRALLLTMMVSIALACSFSMGAPATATPAPSATAVSPSTETAPASLDQIGTFVAQTVEAQQTAGATEVIPPTEAPQIPLGTPVSFGPSNWNGSFLEPWGARVTMALVVLKVNGDSFTGKMSWRFSSFCSALMSLKGEIIQDINSASEQSRWAQHPDYISGDLGGLWLRWTQLENQGNPDCYVNTGDWWYAHIGSSGRMIGIRFMNTTDPNPANGDMNLEQTN